MSEYPAIPSHDRYATVVVGGGPAGIMTALHAAPAGEVLLVEAATLPRHKSCGGMLHEHALRALAAYGPVPNDAVLDPRHVHFRFHDWDRRIRKRTDLQLLNVDRAAFDAWMLTLLPDCVEVVHSCALESFSQDRSGVTVSLKTGIGPTCVRADNLVGADGARSRIRRDLGVASCETYITVQDFLEPANGGVEPFFDCIYMRTIDDCYAYTYVVPKGDRIAVGSVYYPHSRHTARHQERAVEALRTQMSGLGRTVAREAWTALYVRSARDICCGRGRVMLVGEAGGFLSPTSGEGISYALNSGRLAGTALASTEPDRALAWYVAACGEMRRSLARKSHWLPVMESRIGKYVAGFVPEQIVSAITHGL